MRILLAPDKFKHSLTAPQVVDAIAGGLRRVWPTVHIDGCPMADGGEGTVQALASATGGRIVSHCVTGPLPDMKVTAQFGILGDGKTAVIEMAAASGLPLVPPNKRNPLHTTTFGTGELMLEAARLGVEKIILGIGGSATTDGGIGCAQACGLPVILENGEPASLTKPLTGSDVQRVMQIKKDPDSPLARVKITVACDVTNPLFGPTGAAAIFGPQKGALPQDVKQLDAALEQLARRNQKLAVAEMPGAGAAGGLGFGLAAFFSAELRSGIQLVMQAADLPARLKKCDLCITGEGRFDGQSLSGKTTIGVARAAKAAGVPCIVIAGSFETSPEAYQQGVTAIMPITTGPMTLEEAIENAGELVANAAENALRMAMCHRA